LFYGGRGEGKSEKGFLFFLLKKLISVWELVSAVPAEELYAGLGSR